jgi:predicted acyltransferase
VQETTFRDPVQRDAVRVSGAPVVRRLRSVDVFRGVTVAAMVIVNNPGDWSNVYAPLLHAEWHGWTPTDLIFPFFLFIVGVAITLSPRSATTATVLRRGAIIFGLGLFLSGFPFYNLATWRIPGVLQRIALCYVAAAAITRLTAPRLGEIARHMFRVGAVAAVILVAYAGLMLWMPIPGGVAGDLSPEGNLGAWLDRTLLRGHLWRPAWDPEGLLSTLPAIATTLLGVIAGQELTWARNLPQWRRHLAIGGAVCLVAGWLWNAWFPINKSLWTSSYVLFTGGFAALALTLCSSCADNARGWRLRASEPFVALGRNAILLFVLSGLIGRLVGVVMVDSVARISLKSWIYGTLFVPLASPKIASLLFALANLALLYALLAWLHRRRRYFRV